MLREEGGLPAPSSRNKAVDVFKNICWGYRWCYRTKRRPGTRRQSSTALQLSLAFSHCWWTQQPRSERCRCVFFSSQLFWAPVEEVQGMKHENMQKHEIKQHLGSSGMPRVGRRGATQIMHSKQFALCVFVLSCGVRVYCRVQYRVRVRSPSSSMSKE